MEVKGGSLALISQSAKLLAEAKSLGDLNNVRMVGEAAIRVAKQHRDVGQDAIIDAQVIVRTAERKIGTELAAMEKNKGVRAGGNTMLPPGDEPTLSDLGITKSQSSRFQAVARMPDTEFAELEETCREKEKDFTQSSVVSRVKKREKDLADKKAARRAAKALAATEENGIYHGDSFEIADAIPDASCALIFTDPPYDKKSLPLYDSLGELASRILVDGGSLITYCGQYSMPQVMESVGNHLTFFWPLCCLHTGKTAQMKLRGLKVKWKPMLWFVKGTGRRDTHTWVEDLIVSQQEKDAHPWQQSVIEASYYIKRLTRKGELVVDPFCGGGTTAMAAKSLDRQWWTADVNAKYVLTARNRLNDS